MMAAVPLAPAVLCLLAAVPTTHGLCAKPGRLRRAMRAAKDVLTSGEIPFTELPTFGGAAAQPDEQAAISAAREAMPNDEWLASRSDESLLPFVRASRDADPTARLRDASEWRAEWVPPAEEKSWEFSTFFAAAGADKFCEGDRPFLEWMRASDDADEAAPPLQLDGASLLILRPARHKVGAIDAETWLRLISWHGERATSTWAAKAGAGAGAVSIIVDRQGSGLRNQDPALLRVLLPPLTRHFPFALHRAYVAPINPVFWAIWAIARALLPSKVTERFTLFTGDDWRERLEEELGPTVAARLPR